MKNSFFVVVLLAVLLSAVAVGCSDSKYDLAPVRGQVTFAGKPVNWGQVLFRPQRSVEKSGNSGKIAVGPLDAEGRFELTTYNIHDGAIIGPHSIGYSFDSSYKPHAAAAEKFFKALGKKVPRKLKVKESNVEVIAGENIIQIELVK